MINKGLPEKDVETYLLQSGWLIDFSKHYFNTEPTIFAHELMDEMERTSSICRKNGKIQATTPYNCPKNHWDAQIPWPNNWHPMDY